MTVQEYLDALAVADCQQSWRQLSQIPTKDALNLMDLYEKSFCEWQKHWQHAQIDVKFE